MNINRTVERFLRDHNMPATKFGRLAAKDPRLVLDMRMGREPGAPMRERLLAFMSRYNQDAAI
jgi:hypothetical protein